MNITGMHASHRNLMQNTRRTLGASLTEKKTTFWDLGSVLSVFFLERDFCMVHGCSSAMQFKIIRSNRNLGQICTVVYQSQVQLVTEAEKYFTVFTKKTQCVCCKACCGRLWTVLFRKMRYIWSGEEAGQHEKDDEERVAAYIKVSMQLHTCM